MISDALKTCLGTIEKEQQMHPDFYGVGVVAKDIELLKANMRRIIDLLNENARKISKELNKKT